MDRNFTIPSWAELGNKVLVKDIRLERGDDKDKWYSETIVAYSDCGVFTKAHNCPVYHYEFTDYPKFIKLDEDGTKGKYYGNYNSALILLRN